MHICSAGISHVGHTAEIDKLQIHSPCGVVDLLGCSTLAHTDPPIDVLQHEAVEWERVEPDGRHVRPIGWPPKPIQLPR